MWTKPLNENGARAVVLFNEGAAAADITVSFADIGLRGGNAKVRDLQAHADLGTFRDSYTTSVASHGTATLKIVGAEPPRPQGTAFRVGADADLRRQRPRSHRTRQVERRRRCRRRRADQDRRQRIRQGAGNDGAVGV